MPMVVTDFGGNYKVCGRKVLMPLHITLRGTLELASLALRQEVPFPSGGERG